MRPAIHENLRKKVQAVSVQYDQDKKILIVLVSSVSSGRSCVCESRIHSKPTNSHNGLHVHVLVLKKICH